MPQFYIINIKKQIASKACVLKQNCCRLYTMIIIILFIDAAINFHLERKCHLVANTSFFILYFKLYSFNFGKKTQLSFSVCKKKGILNLTQLQHRKLHCLLPANSSQVHIMPINVLKEYAHFLVCVIKISIH